MIAADFTEDRNVTRKNRFTMLRRFDQRQAKPFTFGCHKNSIRQFVESKQRLVADSLIPEKMTSQLGVTVQSIGKLINHPTVLADNNQIDFKLLIPEQFKCTERLSVAFSRLNRSNHKNRKTTAKHLQLTLKAFRKTFGRYACIDICSMMVPADGKRAMPQRFAFTYPLLHITSYSAGYPDDGIGRFCNNIEIAFKT